MVIMIIIKDNLILGDGMFHWNELELTQFYFLMQWSLKPSTF